MRHDQVYKAIFSHPVAARHLLDYIAGMLDDGPEWLATFDPDTLEQYPTEHIDESFRRHLNDLIWRVRLRDGATEHWAYLLVLVEFQSAVDHLMALRIRSYADLLYRELCKERRFGAADRLPPVLPVVIYNGASPWTAASSVEDLVAEGLRPPVVKAAMPVYAGSGYLTLDIARAHGRASLDDVVSLVIGIEQMSSHEEGYATLVSAFAALRGTGHRSLLRVFHAWYSQLVGSGADSPLIEEFEEMERLEEAGVLRDRVQDRVRAWREADRDQGRAEGVERERTLMVRMTERKFGAETAERVAALLGKIDDPERRVEVGEWIIDCTSGEALIARLEGLT